MSFLVSLSFSISFLSGTKREREREQNTTGIWRKRQRLGKHHHSSVSKYLFFVHGIIHDQGEEHQENVDGRRNNNINSGNIDQVVMMSISTVEKAADDDHVDVVKVDPTPRGDLRDGIAMVLSKWNGLQMAVDNKWGGQDSLQKSHQLAADIFSCLSQPKAPYMEDVENLLHESLLLSFNTDIEDGSIEEVAEQLMVLHEEYLQYFCVEVD